MAKNQQAPQLINPPRFDGEIRRTWNKWIGEENFWKFNGNSWEKVERGGWDVSAFKAVRSEYKDQTELRNQHNETDNLAMQQIKVEGRLKAPQTSDKNYSDVLLQYPAGETIKEFSDYVMFEFKRYQPPFKNVDMFAFKEGDYNRLNLKGDNGDNINETISDLSAWNKGSYDYNQSNSYKDAGEQFPSIIMYMPEDISTGFRGNWGGKAFSTVGAGILGAAGQAGLDKKIATGFGTLTTTAQRALGLTSAKVLQKAVKAAGGDQLDNNDVFGSISGAIMNPNTELLYQSVDMRNFMLKFKMVPRNEKESETINLIVRIFKACTLPHRDPGQVMGQNRPENEQNKGVVAGFIGVPNLCKVSFMRGAEEHKVLPKYKMLAVTQVDVNYTPDGAYATYGDAQPVAIELGINFQETKINFAEEVLFDNIR